MLHENVRYHVTREEILEGGIVLKPGSYPGTMFWRAFSLDDPARELDTAAIKLSREYLVSIGQADIAPLYWAICSVTELVKTGRVATSPDSLPPKRTSRRGRK